MLAFETVTVLGFKVKIMFFTPAACVKIKVLQNFIRAFFKYFQGLIFRGTAK